MKTLIILAVILAVFTAYFVFNTEKSISVKSGGNAIPAGVDIAKFVLNQALNLSDLTQSGIIKPKIIDLIQSGVTEEIKLKAGEIKDKVLGEVSELFCTQK